jgi:hypothetical protein
MLIEYEQTVQRLLNDVKAERFNVFDLQDWIGVARQQVAGEGECVRVLATVPTVANQQAYPFSGITVTGTPGASSVLAVRMITGGGVQLVAREWEWFNNYYIPVPTNGTPLEWCQYAQGQLGSIFLNPTPTAVLSLQADCVCLPITLANDSTAEAIPHPWTFAVPYFAAYMAYLTAGDDDKANRMFALYEMFMKRARMQSTPTVLPQQYEGGVGAKLAGTQTPIMAPPPPAPARGAA